MGPSAWGVSVTTGRNLLNFFPDGGDIETCSFEHVLMSRDKGGEFRAFSLGWETEFITLCIYNVFSINTLVTGLLGAPNGAL